MRVKFYCGKREQQSFWSNVRVKLFLSVSKFLGFICMQIVSTSLRSWFFCSFGCIAVEDLQNASGPVCFPVVSFTSCSIALDLVTTLLLVQLCCVKCLLMSGMVSARLVIIKDAVLLSFVSIVANGFIEGCLFEKCVNWWDIKVLPGIVQSNYISGYRTVSQHYTQAQTGTHVHVNHHSYLLKGYRSYALWRTVIGTSYQTSVLKLESSFFVESFSASWVCKAVLGTSFFFAGELATALPWLSQCLLSLGTVMFPLIHEKFVLYDLFLPTRSIGSHNWAAKSPAQMNLISWSALLLWLVFVRQSLPSLVKFLSTLNHGGRGVVCRCVYVCVSLWGRQLCASMLTWAMTTCLIRIIIVTNSVNIEVLDYQLCIVVHHTVFQAAGLITRYFSIEHSREMSY